MLLYRYTWLRGHAITNYAGLCNKFTVQGIRGSGYESRARHNEELSLSPNPNP